MCLIPTNAGEFWTAVSAIVGFLVVLLAIFPIFQNWRIKCNGNYLLRGSILNEIYNLHESCYGKVLSQYDKYSNGEYFRYQIPESDYKYYERLEELFEKSNTLSFFEKRKIFSILRLYKQAKYHKTQLDYYAFSGRDVLVIEKACIDLIGKINKKNRLAIEYCVDPRTRAYKRIENAGFFMKNKKVTIEEIEAVLLVNDRALPSGRNARS
jgi:hypothetical protein